jgi:hypothetical protein
MSEIERDRKDQILAIELTPLEQVAAIEEAKIKKWFKLHNDEYWKAKENAPKTGKITFK